MSFILGLVSVGIGLNQLIPDKPPTIFMQLLDIPDKIVEKYNELFNNSKKSYDVENYHKVENYMREKYNIPSKTNPHSK